jgi:uncharacterized protein YciI
MKHYVVEITFTAPLTRIEEILPQHRAFLQTGYDRGWLLMSGPLQPRTGGLVVARSPSLEEIQSFFRQDPYQLNGVATYRFVEFSPVKRQPSMESWING